MSNKIRLLGFLAAIVVVGGGYVLFTSLVHGVMVLLHTLPYQDFIRDVMISVAVFVALLWGLVLLTYVRKARRALHEGNPLSEKQFQEQFGPQRFVMLIVLPICMMPGLTGMMAHTGPLVSFSPITLWPVVFMLAGLVPYAVIAWLSHRIRQRLVPVEPGEIRVKMTASDRRGLLVLAGTVPGVLLAVTFAGDNETLIWVYPLVLIVGGLVLFAWVSRLNFSRRSNSSTSE